MSVPFPEFTAAERAWLAQLAEVLIPAEVQMPPPSQAGVAEEGLDQILAARPDLAADLKTILLLTQGREPQAAIAELRAAEPDKFGLLAEVAAAAYFMNPQVQAAIGYTGQGPQPIDPHPDYEDDGLLESVKSRGPIYRPTPGR
jgi:hypothetical protein